MTAEKIGQGRYGDVYRAHDKKSDQKVAIKTLKVSSEVNGVSVDSLREIKHLQELRHQNIVNLLDVFVDKVLRINVVLECLAGNLLKVIYSRELAYGPADIKSWIEQSLRGLWWCHQNFVVHRVHYLHVPVSRCSFPSNTYVGALLNTAGYQTRKLALHEGRHSQNRRFRPCA